MSDEKLIHVKLDFADALESKKDILEIEKGFIQSRPSHNANNSNADREDSLTNNRLKKIKVSLQKINHILNHLS